MKLENRPRRLTPSEKRKIIEKIKAILEKDERIAFAYIHGSIVENSNTVRDIDIAVWLKPGIDHLEYALEMGLKLELELGAPVDLHVLNNAPPPFKYSVYTKGKPIVVHDPMQHDMEVVKTILMYSDLQLLRRTIENSQHHNARKS